VNAANARAAKRVSHTRRKHQEDEMKKNEEDDIEHQIKARAFQMWIEEGQPSGRDREHLARAKEELLTIKSAR
jgi:hypothetical protein